MKDSATLQAKVHTWVDQDHPAKTQQAPIRLGMQNGSNGHAAYAYVYFNLPFKKGMTVLNATLRVRTRADWDAIKTLNVRRVLQDWKAAKLKYNNRPDVSEQVASLTKSSSGVNDVWEIDVTELIQTVSNGARWYGLRIGTDSNERLFIQSKHAGQGANEGKLGPELEIEWSDAPQAPTDLSPSGGRCVSIAKPTLRFDFTDNRGSTKIQACQVQIDDIDDDWSSVIFDSGTVPVEEPELDLARTDMPGGVFDGLSGGQEVRWRVRVQDGSGQWSQWSEGRRFKRDVKGTLTITSPGTNGLVEDWTPTIAWDLTGETQTAWAVKVVDAEDPSEELYDTGKTRGDDNSHTLPKGILEDDRDYIVRVRIWDSKDREATPGDPPWTFASRQFHFDEDTTVDPVTNLQAEVLKPTPYVDITFERDTMPDRFILRRNGKVVRDIDEPEDLLVDPENPTKYRIRDAGAHPKQQHTWKVQAVVNGKTSGGPTVTKTVNVEGLWLLSDGLRDVLITDLENDIWEQFEIASDHLPLNSARPVRILQAMGGFYGTVRGTLAPIPELNRPFTKQKEYLYEIKARPNKPVQLVVGDLSFQALISNITHTPLDNPDDVEGRQARVQFDFRQVSPTPWKAKY